MRPFTKYRTQLIQKSMPSPSEDEMDSEIFNQIFDIIKNWDISAPEYYSGYTSGNGSHVKLIIDAIKPSIRNIKIDQCLGDQ